MRVDQQAKKGVTELTGASDPHWPGEGLLERVVEKEDEEHQLVAGPATAVVTTAYSTSSPISSFVIFF